MESRLYNPSKQPSLTNLKIVEIRRILGEFRNSSLKPATVYVTGPPRTCAPVGHPYQNGIDQEFGEKAAAARSRDVLYSAYRIHGTIIYLLFTYMNWLLEFYGKIVGIDILWILWERIFFEIGDVTFDFWGDQWTKCRTNLSNLRCTCNDMVLTHSHYIMVQWNIICGSMENGSFCKREMADLEVESNPF